MAHHLRLGDPSFGVLKVVFHSLFNKLDTENFHGDVYELTKHIRVSFPIIVKEALFLLH